MKWIATFVAVVLLAGVIALQVVPPRVESSMNKVLPDAPPPVSAEAAALHRELLVGDLHTDTTLWRRDLRDRADRGHADLPRLREGNVALQAFTIVTKSPAGQNYDSNDAQARDTITLLALAQAWPPRTWRSLTERALYQAGRLADIEKAHPEELRILRSAADVEAVVAAREAGADTIGALIGIEGAHALDANLGNLQRLQDAGVRMYGLQHFFDNALGGSLHGLAQDGLNDFGREVVGALDERGLIIDVAHSSEATVRDVLALTDSPLVVSHTGFKGHCNTPRNISDALMQDIAAGGGLIGVGFWDAAICDVSPAGIVSAIRYGIDLVGVEHVALGSDYDGATTVPFDASRLDLLTEAMLTQGFSEAEIRAVMGGNMLRFLRDNLPGPERERERRAYSGARTPDYAQADAWVLFDDPVSAGGAMAPAPRADVFYVHQTTYGDREAWNATMQDELALAEKNAAVVARHAGAFADCCRLFAPRYRQASSRAFMERDAGGDEAYARAYDDIAAAFDHYLETENGGRPFFLAGHSQGALHVQELLRDRLADPRIAERLVAAYAVGVPLPLAAIESDFPEISACTAPEDTGCVAAWSTFLDGSDVAAYRARIEADAARSYGGGPEYRFLCTNPLTFDRQRPEAGTDMHLGALPSGDSGLPAPVPRTVAARCDDGLLFVDVAADIGLEPIPGSGSMHFHDIALFFADLGNNAQRRVEAWYARQRAGGSTL